MLSQCCGSGRLRVSLRAHELRCEVSFGGRLRPIEPSLCDNRVQQQHHITYEWKLGRDSGRVGCRLMYHEHRNTLGVAAAFSGGVGARVRPCFSRNRWGIYRVPYYFAKASKNSFKCRPAPRPLTPTAVAPRTRTEVTRRDDPSCHRSPKSSPNVSTWRAGKISLTADCHAQTSERRPTLRSCNSLTTQQGHSTRSPQPLLPSTHVSTARPRPRRISSNSTTHRDTLPHRGIRSPRLAAWRGRPQQRRLPATPRLVWRGP